MTNQTPSSSHQHIQESPSARHSGHGTLSLLRRLLKGSYGFFAAAVTATLVTSLADMVLPQIIRFMVDHVIGSEPVELPALMNRLLEKIGGIDRLRAHLWILASVIPAVALVKVVSQYAFRVCNQKGAETLTKTARDCLFDRLCHLPYAFHRSHDTGDLLQRATSDVSTLSSFLSSQMTSLLHISLTLILSLICMFRLHPLMALIASVPIPLILFHSWRFEKSVSPDCEAEEEAESALSGVLQENLTGARVVRAFGKEIDETEKFRQKNAEYSEKSRHVGNRYSLFWGVAALLTEIQTLAVIVGGAVFCVNGSMTSGDYIAFLSYNAFLTWPVTRLGRMLAEMSRAGISLKRIAFILNAEPEKDDGKRLTPAMTGDIVFDHVSFSYDGKHPVLDDISFTMKGGTRLGILGGTGSGKSTLVLLLDKLYDLPETSGRITIGGVDIRDIRTDYLRKHISLILQDPYLFSKTIAENIAIAGETLSQEDMLQSARDACLDETVRSFVKGYETFVGEKGVTLSGGQKQRVAIARVLTGHPDVIVFDDSLSAVDTETDAKIRSSLESRFGKTGMILISHRITTLTKADRILVLDRGRIVENGTPEELLRHPDGLFRKIYDIQTKGKEVIG